MPEQKPGVMRPDFQRVTRRILGRGGPVTFRFNVCNLQPQIVAVRMERELAFAKRDGLVLVFRIFSFCGAGRRRDCIDVLVDSGEQLYFIFLYSLSRPTTFL